MPTALPCFRDGVAGECADKPSQCIVIEQNQHDFRAGLFIETVGGKIEHCPNLLTFLAEMFAHLGRYVLIQKDAEVQRAMT